MSKNCQLNRRKLNYDRTQLCPFIKIHNAQKRKKIEVVPSSNEIEKRVFAFNSDRMKN